jgi:hypothetical protein
VVRVFEYITEEELRALQPKRSDDAARSGSSSNVPLTPPAQPVVTPIK